MKNITVHKIEKQFLNIMQGKEKKDLNVILKRKEQLPIIITFFTMLQYIVDFTFLKELQEIIKKRYMIS